MGLRFVPIHLKILIDFGKAKTLPLKYSFTVV
jgi:hypothetical protein